MNKKSLFSAIGLMLFFGQLCLAQSKLVNINPVTGTANVTIPLYNITAGKVSVPVALSYTTTGVKPKDVEGTAGMGWSLITSGQISRQVKGLPDDIKADNASNTLFGWLYNSNQSAINSLSINNNGSTCSNETTDINNITTNFGNLYDTEPDIFYVNAPGISCQLVYDQSIAKFRTIPYQDLVITYTTNTTSGLITSFTITNNQGTKYVFATPESVTQTTDLVHNTSGVVNYFKKAYSQYQHGISYYDNWYLTSITDITGQGVVTVYSAAPVRNSTTSVSLYLAGSSTSTLQYNIRQAVTPQVLNTIAVRNDDAIIRQELNFNWATNDVTGGTGQTYISNIMGRGDTINFIYSGVVYTGDANNYTRSFLRNVNDLGCGSPLNYQFAYAGETQSGVAYTTALPDSVSNYFDYWGYYSSHVSTTPVPRTVYVNPSTSGLARYEISAASTAGTAYTYTIGSTQCIADTVNVMDGTLNQIIYAAGGSTTLTYQSNDYLDIPSNTVIKGGGIRVKQIADYDGMNTADNIVRNFSYVNPSTSLSSGKPVTLPAYAFTIPYTGGNTGQSLWSSSTAFSDLDLSQEDHTIMYGYVRQSQAGAGSTLYQYLLPATNWDNSATPSCSGCSTADWAPTLNYIGRTSCSTSYGQVKNDIYSYPFIPNTNYDFERGLLQKVTNYNGSNTEVGESDYTYTRSYGSATAIPALEFDYNTGTTGVLGYGKYSIYTTTSELTYQVINKIFDSSTLSQSQQSTANYTYGSANHKLLTQQTTTNSDGSVLINNWKYIKDYSIGSGTNTNINALYNLQQQNINVPVETWSQVQTGGTTYTTDALLTLFNTFTVTGNTMYLTSQQFHLTAPEGETGFVPFAISGSTFTKDAGYATLPVAEFTAYDYSGTMQTKDDGHHHEKTILKDYNSQKPAITVSNAAWNEMTFDDFDSQLSSPFNSIFLSGTPTYVATGHTGQGAVFTPSQTLSLPANTLTKNAQASNYIFSIWINSGASTGTLSITLTPSSGSPATYTKTYAATGSSWQYYEWKLPLTNITTSTFTVSVSTNATIDIDEVIFYPDNAEVTTNSYDPVTHFQTATTNTNGITTYYANDKWGRIRYVYDRYKNILKKDTYVTPADVQTFGSGVITASIGAGNTSTPVTLSTTSENLTCDAANTTYTWNYGDGTAPVTTATYTAPAHTYVDSGSYIATLTTNSPVFGKFQSSTTFHITPGPMNLTYINGTTSHGVVVSMNFYQNGVLKYNVTPDNISTMHPLKGIYQIIVTFASNSYLYVPATGAGYKSTSITGTGLTTLCLNYASANSYTFTADLTLVNAIQFSVQISSCSVVNGGGID